MARSFQDRGFTLKQIGRQLADAEGLDSPLTERQVTYAIRQAGDGRASDEARMAYSAFERANRDTAEAGRQLYGELRRSGLTPGSAAARVRAIVTREETGFAGIPNQAHGVAATVAERAALRDETQRIWRDEDPLWTKLLDMARESARRLLS